MRSERGRCRSTSECNSMNLVKQLAIVVAGVYIANKLLPKLGI